MFLIMFLIINCQTTYMCALQVDSTQSKCCKKDLSSGWGPVVKEPWWANSRNPVSGDKRSSGLCLTAAPTSERKHSFMKSNAGNRYGIINMNINMIRHFYH